jgi:hypothetical protein
MSDGTTAGVEVLESTDPSAIGIDASLMADGKYRQRVDVPTVAESLASIEQVMATCAVLLASMKDQLPRVSSARVASVAFDAAQAVTISSGTVTTVSTVTTCSTVTACTTVGTVTTSRNLGELARPADALPVQTSHMGAFHIYNAITVS